MSAQQTQQPPRAPQPAPQPQPQKPVDTSLGVPVHVTKNADAERMLERLRDHRDRIQAVAVDELNERYQFVVRCKRNHAGIFLVKNPGQTIVTSKDWHAKYKRLDERWGGDVICQECAEYDENGELVPGSERNLVLHYMTSTTRKDTHFIVPPKYLACMAKDEETFKAEGGMHRVNALEFAAANTNLPASFKAREGVK